MTGVQTWALPILPHAPHAEEAGHPDRRDPRHLPGVVAVVLDRVGSDLGCPLRFIEAAVEPVAVEALLVEPPRADPGAVEGLIAVRAGQHRPEVVRHDQAVEHDGVADQPRRHHSQSRAGDRAADRDRALDLADRSEEPTSELQSLIRTWYDVFNFKKTQQTH